MVAKKVNKGNEPRKEAEIIGDRFGLNLGESSDADCSPSAGNLDANWEILANLARKVLSCTYEARKRAREASGEYASRANMLSQQLRREGTQGENVASNWNEVGRTIIGVTRVTMSKQTCDPHGKDCLMEERTLGVLPRD